MLDKIFFGVLISGIATCFGLMGLGIYSLVKDDAAYKAKLEVRKIAHHTAGTCIVSILNKGNEFEEPRYLYGEIAKVGQESYLIQFFGCDKYNGGGVYKSFTSVYPFWYVDEDRVVVNCAKATELVCGETK